MYLISNYLTSLGFLVDRVPLFPCCLIFIFPFLFRQERKTEQDICTLRPHSYDVTPVSILFSEDNFSNLRAADFSSVKLWGKLSHTSCNVTDLGSCLLGFEHR